MAPLDSTGPLPDLSTEEPAGPNLEFDADFIEFERVAQGKPEQQYGATIIPAEEPDWKDLVSRGWTLLERTYDLRVLTQLAVARLHREGVAGYADTLALIRQVLETRWDQVHPQLDPEDDNDPTLRANAVLLVGNPVRVQRVLRDMPLARSARAGTVSWRDIAVTSGALEAEEGATKRTESEIAAAFRETDATALSTLRDAVAASEAGASGILAAFEAAAGYGTGPDLSELVKLLRDMQRMIDDRAQAAGEAGDDADAAEAGADAAADAIPDGAAPAQTGQPARSRAAAVSIATMGPPTNRADAVRLLDLVVEYYERNEPSSPLPLLIGRARRLADKGFMDLLRDLASEGVSQAERVFGAPEDGSYS